MTAPTSTRERLVTEAMRLFSATGFSRPPASLRSKPPPVWRPGPARSIATSSPRHALLAAGIDRQLDRRRAMHDIRALFAGLGDLRTELSLLCRYLLSVIDQEIELLQIAARTPAEESPRLADAYAALLDSLYSELEVWVQACAPTLDGAQAGRVARIGVDALVGRRASRIMFHANHTDTSDEQYVTEWTEMIAGRIER